ncbi:hypothetical protein NPIL_602301 [Nephila pilipes]|uniref:Uncharacterized protein n=1 Tax=Nephila pilipes TaxID=299642 RepID=A0A8X6TIX4_NEPPI|nr:hypothetical protein NPIL_602301 [Nephila pilipes]
MTLNQGRTEQAGIAQGVTDTVLEKKQEEFAGVALSYVKNLCEKLGISVEPPRRIRRNKIFGYESRDTGLSNEDDSKRKMFSALDRVISEIRKRFQQLAEKCAFLRLAIILGVDEKCNFSQTPEDKEEFKLEDFRIH